MSIARFTVSLCFTLHDTIETQRAVYGSTTADAYQYARACSAQPQPHLRCPASRNVSPEYFPSLFSLQSRGRGDYNPTNIPFAY